MFIQFCQFIITLINNNIIRDKGIRECAKRLSSSVIECKDQCMFIKLCKYAITFLNNISSTKTQEN
jgi:hypothetical protein